MKNSNLCFAGKALPVAFDFLMLGFNLISMVGVDTTETSCLLTQRHYFIFQSCQVTFHSFMFALKLIKLPINSL